MFGIHQSSIWGYSVKDYSPTLSSAVSFTYLDNVGTAFNPNYGNLGTWSPPILAPNGKMFSILVHGGLVRVSDSVKSEHVIAVITPNTSNSSQTNWQALSVDYAFADGTSSKRAWHSGLDASGNVINGSNSSLRFGGKGVLGNDGKIYFIPYGYQTGPPKIVIVNPGINAATTTWSLLDPPITTANSYIGGVLGGDGKIYFIPYNNVVAPFVRLDTNTGSPTYQQFETGYYDGSVGKRFSTNGMGGTLYKEDGTLLTFENINGMPVDNRIIDAIYHPNGRIYFLPFDRRGRIFYCKLTSFGALGEIATTSGLVLPGGISNYLSGSSFAIEKPTSPSVDKTTLKLYIYPSIAKTVGTSSTLDTAYSTDVLEINPTTNTFTTNVWASQALFPGGSNPGRLAGLGSLYTLPNGMMFKSNTSSSTSTKHLVFLQTGIDRSGVTNFIGASSVSLTISGTVANSPAQYAMTGSAVGSGNAIGKAIGLGASLTTSSQNGSGWQEITSVKGYYPNVTLFNYDQTTEGSYYAPPVSNIATSLFNTMFNKPR